MATSTQDKQPYGPLVGQSYTIDGLTYKIRRAEGIRRSPAGFETYRWELRLCTEKGASTVEAWVMLPTDATIADAKARLL